MSARVRTSATEQVQLRISNTISLLPDVDEDGVQSYEVINDTPPLELYGETDDGTSISESEVENFLPEEPLNPFANTLDHSP